MHDAIKANRYAGLYQRMTLSFDAGCTFIGAKRICAGSSLPKSVEERWRFLYEELARIAAIILFLTLVLVLPFVLLTDDLWVHGCSALRSMVSLVVVLIAAIEVLLLYLACYYLESVRIRFSVVLVFIGLCVALPFALIFGPCGLIAT